MSVRHLALAFVAVFGFTAPAVALPIAYTNEAAWLADVAGLTVTTEGFESSPLGTLAVGTTDIGQFSISGNATGANSISASTFQGTVSVQAISTISFGSFDAGPTIFGFAGDWFSAASGAQLTATINGVTFNFLTLLGGNGTGFLGFVDPDGFSSVVFSAAANEGIEVFSLDDVQIATGVSSVPEPASLLLFGTGLAAAGIRRYRRKQ